MMDLLSFIFLNLLGMISPGPDFAIVTHYGLMGSRRAAISATLGISTALIIHVLYCVTGVALFLNSSPKALLLIQFLGGAYIFYLGYKMVFKGSENNTETTEFATKSAFKAGFFCNLLNPKATIFLLSLFGLFAHAMETLPMKIAFAASIPLLALGWFGFLSIFLTHSRFVPFLQKNQKYLIRFMGMALLVLGFVGIFSVTLNVYQMN